MKRLYRRVLAAVLVCLALLANCTPFLSVAFATDVSSTLSVSFGDDWASGDNADDLLSLAGLSYFASNGTNMISYNGTGETLVDTYMRYYKQFYEEQIVQAGATSDFYSWIANSITENALGIQRVAGAVTGAAKILIGEPLAQILNPFLDWFNNKFNPNGSTSEQMVGVERNVSQIATLPLSNGDLFALTLPDSDNIFSSASSVSDISGFSLGDVLFSRAASSSPQTVNFANSSYYRYSLSSSISFIYFYHNSLQVRQQSSLYIPIYLAAFPQSVYVLASGNDGNYYFTMPISYSYFYSDNSAFSGSGLSVTTTSVSSDGSLSYGPDTSSADNIVQDSQTLAVPVIAPSLSGDASLSFETTDSVAELLEKALSSVQAALSDASANTLELPSNDDTLPPEIEILDDDDITWADDSIVEVTPTPTPGAVVTVGPSPVVTPWPVSDPQLAVVGSDGQSTLVDVVQTIKGWTSSLTDVYQMYVNLISALFPFLPDELIVLLNWSLSALIFTGLFKRWWWSHH